MQEIIQIWRNKIPQFKSALEEISALPLPLWKISPLQALSSKQQILKLIQTQLTQCSLMELANKLTKEAPFISNPINFIKTTCSQVKYLNRSFWQVRRKFWSEMSLHTEQLQKIRKNRSIIQKVYTQLNKLINLLQQEQFPQIISLDEQFDKYWLANSQFQNLEQQIKNEEPQPTQGQTKEGSINRFLVRLQKKRQKSLGKGVFKRLGSKPQNVKLSAQRFKEFERILESLSHDFIQQTSFPQFSRRTNQLLPPPSSRSFVLLFDSALVHNFSRRRQSLQISPRKPLMKHQHINYEQDSQQEYIELTGQNLDKLEQQASDTQSFYQESDSFLVQDGYLSQDQCEQSHQKSPTAVTVCSKDQWSFSKQTSDAFRKIIVLETLPIQISNNNNRLSFKKLLPDHLIPELLVKCHQSQKHKSRLIDQFVHQYPQISKTSVKDYLKASLRKEDKLWKVKQEVVRQLGLQNELMSQVSQKIQEKRSVSKSLNAKMSSQQCFN